jgi:tripartite-type tricarboxylate transporter receptor subunit TctC
MEAGIKLVHIPYRGAAPALTDMSAGSVMLPDLPAVLTIRSGAVTGLALTTERSLFVPDLPTTTELGVPGVIPQLVRPDCAGRHAREHPRARS